MDALLSSPRAGVSTTPEWRISAQPVPYPEALALMEARAQAVHAGAAPELVWLLEHPPLFTAGTSADAAELMNPQNFPVYAAGRGGRYTYHGPGQRVVYLMLDLKQRGADVRKFVCNVEEWIIRALRDLGVRAERRAGRIGIWVAQDAQAENGREEKIAAIGIRIKRWVTLHGMSINVHPDLSHFTGIVPCGLRAHGVTSLQKLGVAADMSALDAALQKNFSEVFVLCGA